jgi:serine/threonine protein kinase/tetratricopeptide (TPR) repeat protein
VPEPSERPVVDAVAAAILNGTPIDWPAFEATASAADRELLEELRLLCTVADLHRDIPSTAGEPGAAGDHPTQYWGRLRLIERIGGGSFGSVYRAWDPRLRREVALKLIAVGDHAEHRSASIIREGRMLARVRHPGVVTIYDAEQIDGRVGLSMEFVAGPTLEARIKEHGPFTADETIEIGTQLCQALAAAHDAGVLHRDVKAANVVIRHDGRVVLMDFGAGRQMDEADPGTAGTPMYLAPEVLAGQDASVRSDVYGLGVLLHYMVTGSYPVQAASLSALRGAHAKRLHDERTPMPPALGRLALVLARATDPRPERRFENVAAFEAALTALRKGSRFRLIAGGLTTAAVLLMAAAWSLGITTPSVRRGAPAEPIRIAVMPFDVATEGDRAASAALREGIARDLITGLQMYEGSRVIAAESMLSPSLNGLSVEQIRERLGVQAILTGTLTRDGARQRFDLRLVRAGASAAPWTGTYEVKTNESSEVRRSMTEDVARALGLVPGVGRQWPTRNPQAHALYVKAMTQLEGTLGRRQLPILRLLQEAVALDPEFAAAHAAAAEVYLLSGEPDALARATAAAERAVVLDPGLPASHVAAAVIRSAHGDWAAADRSYRHALTLGPSDAMARVHYAHWLSRLGRFDAALAHARDAARLDPYTPRVLLQVASVLRFARQWDASIVETKRVLDIDKTYSLAYLNLGHNLLALGRFDEAIAAFEMYPVSAGNRGDAYAQAGRTVEARRIVAELEKVYAEEGGHVGGIAQIYSGLGEIDLAFEWLGRAAPLGEPFPNTFLVARVWDPLRSDQRFAALLKRYRLDPASLTGF